MIFLRCYLDPSDPVAAPFVAQLPEVLVGQGYAVDYLPIRRPPPASGPANEVAPQAGWDADALLSLLWSCARPGSTPSRWALAQVLAAQAPDDGAVTPQAQGLCRLTERLAAQRQQDEAQARQAWCQASEAARASGLSRLPAIEMGAQRFIGLDGLARLRAAIDAAAA